MGVMPQFWVKRCQPSAHQYAYVKSVKQLNYISKVILVKLSKSQLKGFSSYLPINK